MISAALDGPRAWVWGRTRYKGRLRVRSSAEDTPLVDAVIERASRLDEKPFHVPGHKRGRALHASMRRLLEGPGGPLAGDLTEIAGLDNLHAPSGPIAAAQTLAAASAGADRAFFLVNGCTAGIHAAVAATCPPGTTLVLARNCHLSAFHAAVIAGCDVEWARPEEDAAHGVAHCVAPGALAEAIEAARARGVRVGAALVVSPTYYGVAGRIDELAAVCHAAEIPLIVDEAHGGHFGPAGRQHPGAFPPGALQSGADAAVQSTHKTLGAMTQAAALHLKGPRVDAGRAARTLQALQSSSPSYMLMASLDAARAQADAPGAWAEPLAAAAAAREGLRRVPGVVLLEEGTLGCGSGACDCSSSGGSRGESSGSVGRNHGGGEAPPDKGGGGGVAPAAATAAAAESSVGGFDPLRVVVNVAGLGLTGFEAAEALEARFGVVPELATLKLVVLVVGPGSRLADAEALVEGVTRLVEEARHAAAEEAWGAAADAKKAEDSGRAAHAASGAEGGQPLLPQQQQLRQQAVGQQGPAAPTAGERASSDAGDASPARATRMAPRAAFFAPTERVPLELAAGRKCAELLCPYPPGVPLLFPGEQITADAVAALRAAASGGGVVVGASDASLGTVLVVAEGEEGGFGGAGGVKGAEEGQRPPP